MPALNHKPEERNEGYPEGTYSFKITSVKFCEFASGNDGMRLVFDVWNKEGVGFTAYENIVTSLARVKWRLEQFCDAVGLDYDDENLASEDFENKEGRAKFERKPDSKWLKVDSYLPVDAPGELDEAVVSVNDPGSVAGAINAEDVPF